MNYLTLYNTVRNNFRTLIAEASNPPLLPILTHYDNDLAFQMPDDSMWARMQVLGAQANLIEIGYSKRTRHTGLMVVNIFAPLGMGDANILQLGDLIEAAFGSKVVNGVTYRSVSVASIGRDDRWWVGTVDVPFHADALS